MSCSPKRYIISIQNESPVDILLNNKFNGKAPCNTKGDEPHILQL